MKQREIAKRIIETLEKEHINLYHSISKEKFNEHKDQFLLQADNLDQIHFEAGMNKLCALFKDAHTGLYLHNKKILEMDVKQLNSEFYIQNNGKYEKIIAINNKPMRKIVNEFSKQLYYETEEWKYFCIETYLTSLKFLSLIDVANINDEEIMVETDKDLINVGLKNKFEDIEERYKYSKDASCLLYIKYPSCREYADYSFQQFLEDIKHDCSTLPNACLIDVRRNNGGNSLIIRPLIDWLEENKIKTYVLMDNGTFSSGRFVVTDCKKRLNATLLGTATGGSSASYGYCKNFKVGDYSFSCSIRYWDFSKLFGYVGAIKPDIEIKQSIKDLNSGTDGQLLKSIQQITNEIKTKNT